MARTTYASAYAWGAYERIKRLVALLVSGKNEDGTDATIPAVLPAAPNVAIAQVTAGVASGVLVAARTTRRKIQVRNTDAANTAYVGTGVVTSATGYPLKANETITIETTAALNCIRATADVVLAYVEVYD